MTTDADVRPETDANPTVTDEPIVQDPPGDDPGGAAVAVADGADTPDPDPAAADAAPADEPQDAPPPPDGREFPDSTDDDVAPSHSPDDEMAAALGLTVWQIRALRSLRAPARDDELGYKPTVWCRACSDAAKDRQSNRSTCQQHARKNCEKCGQYITEAHNDLSYMGHAAVTRRLIIADPTWSWSPMSRDVDDKTAHLIKAAIDAGSFDLAHELLASCLPQYSEDGLWINLTVAGITKPGFGDAAGKRGANAIKEVIGDALRNAGMRFGIGLELWHKGEWSDVDDTGAGSAALPTPAERRAEAANPNTRQAVADAANDSMARQGGQQAERAPVATAAGDAAPAASGEQSGAMDVQVVVDTLAGVRGRAAWTALRKSAASADLLGREVTWNGEAMTLDAAFDARARELAARS